MQEDIRENTSVLLTTDQRADMFLHTTLGDGVIARLFSVRCLEAQIEALPCQDYAKVVKNQEGTSLCFCVCDGVGSSFNGELAARYVAMGLVNWLQTLPAIPVSLQTLPGPLHSCLEQWASTAQRELENLDISPETPRRVREIIEQGRRTRGSETVFLGGRIDYEPWDSLDTTAPVHVLLCWMGNVTAYLFTTADEPITLGDLGNDTHRWSTMRGCCGSLTLVTFLFDKLDRLLIHTDGLDAIGQELASLDDHEIEERIQQLLQLPKNDDMTALDLQWKDIFLEDRGAL